MSQQTLSRPPRPLSFFQAIPVRILLGELSGSYWLPASGGKLLRHFLGTYEREQTMKFRRFVKEGDVLFDIGASVGYYSVLAAKLVGDAGKVVAFEPDPTNARYLRHHIAINCDGRVTVYEAAVGEAEGHSNFARGKGTGTGRLSDCGDLEVTVHCVDQIVNATGCVPTHMKIDVEGFELEVLRGAERTIDMAHPTLFLSTHTEQIHKQCCEFLKAKGYTIELMGGNNASSHEILCVHEETTVAT